MERKFTKLFLTILLSGFFVITNSIAQNCDIPSNVSTTNVSNFSATLNWDSDVNVDHYSIRYKEMGTSNLLFKHNITSSFKDINSLISSTIYVWQIQAFCSTGNTNPSGWSVIDTFTTTNYPVDCNNTPNGMAYTDSCGNCVEGITGNLPCIDFTPTVTISLSNLNPNSSSDFSFSFSQDPNEPDVSSAVFASDGGSFDFTGLSTNDVVGTSTNMAAGGQINVTTTLMVDFIISTDKISIKSVDDISGQVYSSFTVENTSTGILIISTSLPDNNNVTSGNSQSIIITDLFVNPVPSNLTFTSTINSELGDVALQTFSFTIDSLDCNGDFGGSAFIDSCGNCVGGN
ncbi:MAG: fibronectin type III domain-containing protein, partial [Flavobacteriales bacterium]